MLRDLVSRMGVSKPTAIFANHLAYFCSQKTGRKLPSTLKIAQMFNVFIDGKKFSTLKWSRVPGLRMKTIP